MRKLWYGLLMAVLLLPVLAACGGTTTDGGTASAPGVSAEASVEAPPTEASTEAPSVAASAEASMEASMEASAEASEEASEEASAEASVEASGEASAAGSAEASAAGSAAGEAGDIRIGLVTDVGKINDGTFNQFAYEGLERAGEELGVQIDYIETQQPTDYERNLEQFAGDEYDMVIGVGFLMGEALQTVASRYPEVNFAIVDFAYGDSPPENVKGLVFNEDQSGYIAGTIAALISQSNSIGVVGGIEDVPAVKKFVLGYEAGAKAQKPDITVAQVYIPSFVDAPGGAEAARSQIAEGADVIFGAGGQTGSGAIEAAASDGVFVIGVDQDEFNTTFSGGSKAGADKIVSSAVKRVDNAVFDAIKSVVDGEFSNELYVGSVENGGIDYAECHDACAVFTDEIKATVEEVKTGLGNGSIETGVTLP